MRILHVITRRELRGAEVVARDLCVALQARGHEVSLVGLFAPPDLAAANAMTNELADVYDISGPQRRGFRWKTFRGLQKIVREFQPDIVQANAFNALKFAAIVKRADRCKWPLVYRNVGVAGQWVTRPGQRWWGRFLLRQVPVVLSVSEASRTDFARTYQYPISRIQISHQGVRIPRPETRAVGRAKLVELAACSPHDRLLIHVGSFTAEKNHSGLLEAFSCIQLECDRARLLLIGDGPLRETVAAQAKTMGLGDAIHILGAQGNAAALIAGADLMLLTSHVEGIPGVVLEASAAGVPVVGTCVGGMAEIVIQGATGFLVPAGDMQALAEKSCQLLASPDLMQRMGQAARAHVVATHDQSTAVDAIETLYTNLVHGPFNSASSTAVA